MLKQNILLSLAKCAEDIYRVFLFQKENHLKKSVDPDFNVTVHEPSSDIWRLAVFEDYHLDNGLIVIATYNDDIVGYSCFKKNKENKTIIVERILAKNQVVFEALLENNENKGLTFNKIEVHCIEDQDLLIKACVKLGYKSVFNRKLNLIVFTKGTNAS